MLGKTLLKCQGKGVCELPPYKRSKPLLHQGAPLYKLEALLGELCKTTPEELGWGKVETNIIELWSGSQGEDVTIAVLDTGCDIAHKDLEGQIVAYKNFTGDDEGDIGDYVGHGTHCAGIIAAKENAIGVVGVAPRSKLLVGKVLNDRGYGQTDWIANGILWAVEQGADIISMSLGGPVEDEDMKQAIKFAIASGVIVIAAAGNSGEGENTIGFPGGYDDVLTVGALDQGLSRSYFSSTGPSIDFMAPGRDIISTIPNDKYASFSGTSMATPFLAGTVALLVGYERKMNRELPEGRNLTLYIRDLLKLMSRDLEEEGFDNETGYGVPMCDEEE